MIKETSGGRTSGGRTSGGRTSGEQTSGEQTLGEQTSGEQTSGEQTLGEQTLGGRYRVIDQLGSSVFSETYLARDQQLPEQPICVVKQLQTSLGDRFDWQRAKRFFEMEAQVLYRLSAHSRQIPRLLAHFTENQQFYLVQEYIEGNDLSQELIPAKPWPEPQVIGLIRDILEVLQVVHAQGVIHRDLKPRNLIRRARDSQIVLIDFGAVKQVSHQTLNPDDPATESILIGTPGYMAGEQRAGKPRYCSDLYAVGMIGLQALTGLDPKEFGEDTQGELCWRQMARVSPRFAAILTRLVRTHWRDRYQTVEAVLANLEKLQGRSPEPARTRGHAKTTRLKLSGLALVVAIGIITTPSSPWRQQLWQNLGQSLAAYLPNLIAPVATGDLVPLRSLDSESGAVLALAMHPQGRVVVSGGQDKIIQFWDMQSGTMLTQLMGHQQEISALDLTPDGQTLVSGSGDTTLKIWNLRSGTLRYTLMGHQGRVNAVRVTPDGRWAVSGSSDQTIKVWDLQSGRSLRTLEGHAAAVNQLAISTDSQFVMSACENGTIKVWNLQTGQLIRTLTGHQSGVRVLTMSPDNQTLVSGANDKMIVWKMATGQRLQTFPPTSQAAGALAFSRDGQYLVSAHLDGTVKLWNWQTSMLLETRREHSDSIGAVVICPNNRTMVSASTDQRLGIWRLRL